MVFFESTAKIRNLEELMEDNKDEKQRDGICRTNFQLATMREFEESGRQCVAFIQTIRKRTAEVICGVMASDRTGAEKSLSHFFELADIRSDGVETREITMNSMRNLLRMADQRDFIDDDSVFLNAFEIDGFLRWAPRYFDYCEEILSAQGTKAGLREKTRRLACEGSMLPELERVFQGPAVAGVAGHPVHYLLQADDKQVSKSMAELLLTALFQSGRIRNRRFGALQLKCDEDTEGHKSYLEQAYRYCDGGALMIDLAEAAQDLIEDDQASGTTEAIITVCDSVKMFRNSVLTLFCLPRNASKCDAILRENLGSIPLVEIREDVLSGERSKKYLRRLAKRNGITAPRSLMKLADDPEKGWLPGDLNAAFDRWLAEYLKQSVYPQYASFAASHQESAKAKPVGSAYSELQSMIGLHGAKKVIEQALDYYKAQKIFRDRGLKTETTSMHMTFTGNPGTAKTTVARLFARIMKENGVLSHGDLFEVGRGDLVGRYVGWTAKTVQEKFRAARGSVLFIDEAYSLVDDREGSYGDEAINTIVQEMENCRGDTVVIFAGYPDKMERFLERNPGLRSRIAFHIPFENYSEDELCSIVEAIAGARGLSLAPGVREKLEPLFQMNMREPDFGNGRYARSLVERAAMCQASRLIRGDVVHLSDEELKTLLPEDFQETVTAPKPEQRRIGFVA